MSAERVILLLGRRDEPTDGVVDYCERLRDAGIARGLSCELAQVRWAERGWHTAVQELREAATDWRGGWVILQFTTLAWSRRGFPLRAPRILEQLRRAGVRTGVMFHDFSPLAGAGLVGRVREYSQLRVLRQLYSHAELAVFPVPVNKVSWLPLRREKATFIPVGANCPEAVAASRNDASHRKVVAVYSITGGDRTMVEIADLDAALRQASHAVGPLRLLVFGRGSQDAEAALRSKLAGANVEIETLGLVSPEAVSQTLSQADVLLFVRGQISSRRGSAIAGIACGLPIVCYAGPETSWPVTEAGIVPVPKGDREALAAALTTVLSDEGFRSTLAARSRDAQKKYFSWSAIAGQFVAALQANLGGLRAESETASPHRCSQSGIVV